jgi:ubiquinone/menaquinone biosynthesis C-methylase UbiE
MHRSARLVAALAVALAACTGGRQTPEGRPYSQPYAGDLTVFDYPERAERLQVERVMDALGLAPGRSVADIGAGSGWFSMRAARRVGPDGTVYAVDINPQAVVFIAERAAREGLPNVLVAQGSPDDANLPRDSVDAVLFLNAYHEIARPVDLLRGLHPALRPGARIGVIDRNGSSGDHHIDASVVKQEAARAGYRLIDEQDFVKGDGMDYLLVFQSDAHG